MDDTTRQNDQLPPIWNIRIPRDDRFIDDNKSIQAIHDQLRRAPICIVETPDSAQDSPGASATVREFAYRHADDYQAVWWIQGGHEASMALEYTQFAVALDLVAGVESADFKTVDSVKTMLDDHTGWLLIFDDIADPAIIEPLLPNPVDGHVIITSSHATPETDVSKIVVLPVDAIELAQSYTEDDFAPEDVPEILMHSPFALNILSAAARRTDQSTRAMLHTVGRALREVEDPDYIDAMQMAIRYPLSIVAQEMPPARDFLALCSFLASNDIPRFLFHNGDGIVTPRLARILDDDREFQKMLDFVGDLNIITHDNHTSSVHSSFQAAFRSSMAQNARKNWINAVMRLLDQAFPVETKYKEPSNVCAQLIPHILHATDAAEEEQAALPLASTLLYRAGLYLHAHDLLIHAQMCYLRSINIAERKLGTVHPDIATRVNSLGIVEHRLGNLDNAQTCFERAFEICETLYGPTNEAMYANVSDDMLTMPLRNLCMVLEEKGNVSRAQRAFEKAMRIFVEVYGWNHSVVAECAHSFGQTWMHLGKYQKAQNCFVKAVRAEENAAECDHQALARYLESLGMALIQNDHHESAVEQLQRSFRLFKSEYGDEDIRLARPYVLLGHAFRELSKLDDAETMYRKALSIIENNPDQSQPDELAKLLTNLGAIMLGQSEPGQARSYLDEALELLRNAHGDNAPELITVQVNLGKALDGLDAPSQAKDMYNAALKILQESDTKNFSDHATILYRLGRSHETEGDLGKAQEFYEHAMNIDSQHLGQEHPHVARDSSGLGSVLAKQGDTIVAMGHLTHALDIYENKYGKDHPKTRGVRKKLDKLTM